MGKAFSISSRRRAREAALQALYQCDTTQEWNAVSIDTYFECFQGPRTLQSEATTITDQVTVQNHDQPNYSLPDYEAFARLLAFGVLKHLSEVDLQVSAASKHWSLERMNRVDRNILRMATYELLNCEDVPVNVTLNEAIEIAKRFGSQDSAMFVNGVLDNVAHAMIEQGLLAEAKLASGC